MDELEIDPDWATLVALDSEGVRHLRQALMDRYETLRARSVEVGFDLRYKATKQFYDYRNWYEATRESCPGLKLPAHPKRWAALSA